MSHNPFDALGKLLIPEDRVKLDNLEVKSMESRLGRSSLQKRKLLGHLGIVLVRPAGTLAGLETSGSIHSLQVRNVAIVMAPAKEYVLALHVGDKKTHHFWTLLDKVPCHIWRRA